MDPANTCTVKIALFEYNSSVFSLCVFVFNVFAMANYLFTEIYLRMDQVEHDNRKLSDKMTDLTRENDYLRHQQESVRMRVSSRLHETGESLRYHQSTMAKEHSTHEV